MIEELLHPHAEILLVVSIRQVVRLTRIRQQDHLLASSPRRVEELQPFHVINRTVFHAMQNHERRLDLVDVEDR